jgi:hypothetical protein
MHKIRTNPEHTSTPLHGKFCCTPKRFCSSNEIYWLKLLNPGGGPADWVKKYRQNRNSLIIDIIDNLTSINGEKNENHNDRHKHNDHNGATQNENGNTKVAIFLSAWTVGSRGPHKTASRMRCLGGRL